jgi:hypothetical protein
MTMKNRFYSKPFDLLDFFPTLCLLLIVVILTSSAATAYFGAKTLQRALNAECKANYSLMEVAISGDKLVELCRIQNQQITVK